MNDSHIYPLEDLFSKLTSDLIEKIFIELVQTELDTLANLDQNNYEIYLKRIFGTCKKVIESPILAKYKFYALVLIVEIMRKPSDIKIETFNQPKEYFQG